jgi:hypothetical protein
MSTHRLRNLKRGDQGSKRAVQPQKKEKMMMTMVVVVVVVIITSSGHGLTGNLHVRDL